MRMKALIDSIEILVDPPAEVIKQSPVAAGMGVLYRYHPDSARRLAEGFPRFSQTTDGRLVLARAMDHLIVGYALIARPDPRERWRDSNAPEIWELGIIEVARGWRRRGIGRQLIRACVGDGKYDDRIVLATAYSWHWDLQRTKLSKAEYREVLLRLFGPEDFQPLATNEPNIQEDPANQLLARIGPRVSQDALNRFLGLLQTDRPRAAAPGESLSSQWKKLFDLAAGNLQPWSPIWWLATWSGITYAMLSTASRSCSSRGGAS